MQHITEVSLYYFINEKYEQLKKQIKMGYISEKEENNYIELYEYIDDQLIYTEDQVIIMNQYMLFNSSELNKENLLTESLEEFYNDIAQEIESLGYTIK